MNLQEKIQKKSVFGATADISFYHFLTKYFPQIFFLLHTSLMNHSFMLYESIRKRNNPFLIYSTDNRKKWQQHLPRKAQNVAKKYNNNFNIAY